MKDEDVKRLLRNSLEGRRAPEGVRARLLARFRRGGERRWIPSGAIAAGLLVSALLVSSLLKPTGGPGAELPAPVLLAFEQHAQSGVDRHANQSITPRESAQVILDAIGRPVEIPGLRDAGYWQIEAHRCADTGMAHMIYLNSWSKLSCFILDGARVVLEGGVRLSDPSVEGWLFSRGETSAVAIREGGVLKIWVSAHRPKDLEKIAVDAEHKRYQFKILPLHLAQAADPRPMSAVLLGMPGVEDFQLEPSRTEAFVRYDPRRVSADEIAATLEVNGLQASPRGWNTEATDK